MIQISEDWAQRAKIEAAKQRVSIKALIEAALKQYLTKRKN